MDYKGYNIAIHEFGHNVEQTLSLYDVDHYMMNGVPNTAFTEALAFIFQKRDLQLLGIEDQNPKAEALETLDVLWSAYEIMGVSLLDMRVWKWLYAHPDATADELKNQTIKLAREIWNDYFAPVYGVKDAPILAVYSHMISNPLYLSNYAYGNIIEFQLEQHLKQKEFAEEVQRIFRQGQLTPNEWMRQAVGDPIDVQPMLESAADALDKI
jgi:oligoendopeptidase F